MKCKDCKWYKYNMVHYCRWCKKGQSRTVAEYRLHVLKEHSDEQEIVTYPCVEGYCCYDRQEIDKPESSFCHHWEAK